MNKWERVSERMKEGWGLYKGGIIAATPTTRDEDEREREARGPE